MNERTENVYENKGALWKTLGPLVSAVDGSAGFQPASSYARCGLEARAPRPTGHEMAEDPEMYKLQTPPYQRGDNPAESCKLIADS